MDLASFMLGLQALVLSDLWSVKKINDTDT